MKYLSRWATKNPVKARISIIIGHLLLVLYGLLLGFITYVNDIPIPGWILFALANIFFLAYFFYPDRKQKTGWFRYTYVKQKLLDFTLVVSYAFVIALGFNHFAFSPTPILDTGRPGVQLIVHKITPQPDKAEKKALKSKIKASIKELKVNIKEEIKALKKERKERTGKKQEAGIVILKILLIALTVGVVIGLGALIGAWSCELSCSGQEGLAWILLVLGWGGLIWLGVIAIKNILRIGRDPGA